VLWKNVLECRSNAMKFRNGLGAGLLGMLVAAAAGAEAPIATDMPEFIVTAKYPGDGADDKLAATNPPELISSGAGFDAASALKEIQAEQVKAIKGELAKLLSEPSR
jgi:hypothetical protein